VRLHPYSPSREDERVGSVISKLSTNMKKTLIILLSLAGVSIAGEPIWVSNSVPSTYTLDSSIFTTGSLSIAMRLDVEKLAAKSAANFSGSQKIVELNGLWNNANKEGLYNVNLNGSSDYDTSTLYMGLLDPKHNSTYSHNQSLGSELSGTNIFTTATDWSQICRASLVVQKRQHPKMVILSLYILLLVIKMGTRLYIPGVNRG